MCIYQIQPQIQQYRGGKIMYPTPKRRHSSLFEKMENEIKKISNKLSAAKESYREAREKSASGKKHMKSIGSLEEKHQVPTIRKKPKNYFCYSYEENDLTNKGEKQTLPLKSSSKFSTTAPFRRRHSNLTPFVKESESLKSPTNDTYTPPTKIIMNIQKENSQLWRHLGELETIATEQSYRVGYLKASLKQTNAELKSARQRESKENIYFTTLLEHYKGKAKKYKKMLQHNQAEEISINEDVQL